MRATHGRPWHPSVVYSTAFRAALAARTSTKAGRGRRFVYVPYDQLSDGIGPLAHEPATELGIVVIESPQKAARRPYHRQKLAYVLANQRHFALEQAARGVLVRFLFSPDGYAPALARFTAEHGPIRMMEAAEYELRTELAPLVEDGRIVVLPHEGWLTTNEDFQAASVKGAPPWRMDRFYAAVRARTGILMDDAGKPLGGRLSHDADNRKPWRGEPAAPTPPRFVPDVVTREVGALIESQFSSHPGTLDLSTIPATRADCELMLAWGERACLPHFGPFEDAMSTRSSGLFHTRISPLLNLHRILPRDVVARALALPIPLSSQEGFVRQILGWREFVRHIHRETAGLSRVPGVAQDAGGPNALGAKNPLPAAYWGTPSGLACLDRVVTDVWREGWSHHITRLMILGNLATLLDVSPRALSDWFWVAYIDAFDWVVEPNVLGMDNFAMGDRMVTKPYVAGAPYIDRMSDYCGSCAFSPKETCPVTPLYWAFLERHRTALAHVPRMLVPLAALKKRAEDRRSADRQTFEDVSAALREGRALSPPKVAPVASRRAKPRRS